MAAGRGDEVPPVEGGASAEERSADSGRLLDELRRAVEERGDGPPGSVQERLFREGHQFDFFQAVRLLEELFSEAPTPGTGFTLAKERIRFRPHDGLAFPAADIKQIDLLGEEDALRAVVVARFMGLYGIDSPLPAHFANMLALSLENTGTLRDFLDIFNHRLYSLFYRSWKKFQPELHFRASGGDPYSRRLLCLAGLAGLVDRSSVSLMRLAPLAALLARPSRSASGLRRLLGEFFGDIPLRIVENVPRMTSISDRLRLGRRQKKRMALGRSAMLGGRLLDVSGKFRLVLGPLDFDRYQSLLPGEEHGRMLHYLVRLYAPDYLAFDVELLLRTDEIPTLRLSDRQARLGTRTWLGSPRRELVAHVVDYEK